MYPIVKWAGGKRKLASTIYTTFGDNFNNYYEPFAGGAAIMFINNISNATCIDINNELINFYNIVKNHPIELIYELENNFYPNNSKEFYYAIRRWDRDSNYNLIPNIKKAARFIYLNKTCYNGLWRVNKQGQNNVPFGGYKQPSFLTAEQIITASEYFNKCNINFINADYSSIIQLAEPGDLVYFDPPYDVEEGVSSFIGYSSFLFGKEKQIELKNICDKLRANGIRVVVSNSNTEFIKQLYQDSGYQTQIIPVQRNIGSKMSSRRRYDEILIIG